MDPSFSKSQLLEHKLDRSSTGRTFLVLRKQGFFPPDCKEANVSWLDRVMTLKPERIKEASMIAITALEVISQSLEQSNQIPDEKILKDQFRAKLEKHYATLERIGSRIESISEADQVAYVMTNIPADICKMLTLVTVESQLEVIKLLHNTFAVFNSLANSIPKSVEQFVKSISNKYLEKFKNKPERTTQSPWLSIFLAMSFDSSFINQADMIMHICQQKNREILYPVYTALLSQNDNDELTIRQYKKFATIQNAIDLKKLSVIIENIDQKASDIIDIYFKGPDFYLTILEKIAKLSSRNVQKGDCIAALKFCALQPDPQTLTLLGVAATDSKKLALVLDSEFITAFSDLDFSLRKECTEMIRNFKDVECYQCLIAAVRQADIDKARLLLDASKFNLGDHAAKKQVLIIISKMEQADLPAELSLDYLQSLIKAKKKTAKYSTLADTSIKRERKSFSNLVIENAYSIFSAQNCGRLFTELCDKHGENGLPVQTAIDMSEIFSSNGLYLNLLDNPLTRRLYFRTVLANTEYAQELKQRLEFFDEKSNPIVESILFSTWVASIELERSGAKQPPAEDRIEQGTTLMYRIPNDFSRVTIAIPSKDLQLDMTAIAATIPLIESKNVRVIDSDILDSVRSHARSLRSDGLFLCITGKISHSQLGAIKARISPEYRKNLYLFYDVKQLYRLLGFLNSSKAARQGMSGLM